MNTKVNTESEKDAEIARLRAQLEERNGVTIKVGQKGGIVVSMGGRFPVTLYADQWEQVLDNAAKIRAFIETHPELKRKK